MSVRYGVFLARMQPVHNAHLWLVDKALAENDKVLVVLGSENKIDMHRNPYSIELREEMFRECLTDAQNARLHIITLPDWSMETERDDDKIWGRYLYYNVVAAIGQKRFTIYFSDELELLDSWFKGTEVSDYVTYRHFERNNLFDGLSATKIRQAFMTGDKAYVAKFCPPSVQVRFDHLAEYYKRVESDPKPDFSME